MTIKLSLSLALAFIAATAGSSAFAQVWYPGNEPPQYDSEGVGSDVSPGRTGGGSFGYNDQVQSDY